VRKIWIVARHEYLRHVLRKRFILSILSVPFFILLTIGIGVLSSVLMNDWRPIGYVDRSGAFAQALPPEEEDKLFSRSIEITRFDAAEQAEQAIRDGQIQAAFILEKDYLQTGAVTVISDEKLSDNASRYFHRFILFNLLAEKPSVIQERVLKGPELFVRSLTDEREFQENNLLAILVPLLSGVLLVIAVNASGGYLLQAVSEEKENRTIEIIVTSLSPNQ
jgi:ABC-2 type transport system permease protein